MALATAAAAPLLVAPLAWAPRRAGGSLPEVARILVGLGDALDGERLVARACALAGRLGARLAVAHVVETTDVAAWPEPLRAAGLERSRADAEERLAAMQVAFEETVPVELGDEVHLAFGGPVARDLAGLADSQHADLLVVGSGVSAARLVPLARCPLLVLPTKKGDGPLIQKNPRAPARPAGFSE
jgi:nucleotide-binding universal stress UspA family protein